MNKEKFIKTKDAIRKNIKDLEAEFEQARKDYIEANKPCCIGDIVEVTRNSGAKEIIVVKSIVISKDDVVVFSFRNFKHGKETGGVRYLTQGHGSVDILSLSNDGMPKMGEI